MDGILPLYKPTGFTSHDCVMKVRRLFQTKKVGHTGTLDPDVEGVLPICIGEATKIIPFVQQHKKVYIAEIYLGIATTTEDKTGEIIERKETNVFPTDEQIADVLQQFHGEIRQVPPMYSAVKVDGKRLYEYARENIEVKRPERTITIYDINRLDNEKANNQRITMEVVCSKGTYIRTLCVDIGRALGFPAHMSFLERTESDSIIKEDTYTFAELEQLVHEGRGHESLLPIDYCLQHLARIEVDETMKLRVLQGQKFPLPKKKIVTNPFAMYFQEDLLAIYEIHPQKENEIKPVRVFNIHKR